jgi:hypothetical protein
VIEIQSTKKIHEEEEIIRHQKVVDKGSSKEESDSSSDELEIIDEAPDSEDELMSDD